ncbi:hypothetical protein PUV52_03740 [Leuconostoc mesenteroides]|uniref:Uncharacterized protein n=1 Tax=Leuconostoc mesenteroides subsp. mesenteroides (strain ATCC 8293 / DSM 20343 / BCRC 11652 / CCM 1803 / JCM 6124 / NCDO 523 / NBRC 100496 / NCIMB 8023 / NCTC 12954 / NRRL B-1118 / 37Y) TaxID=203120 RepID=Q03W99_LEUMM|nr:DUF6625 family protein [Leuconostoc mesenteroides]ABJ62523.1 hypothetical protein LEUM_1430 [Leuconostoc mesenteroides subsp. mesenteroides ATCC 8293]MCT3042243.1 hypothetical protein [Leuconostoc mesenteroides]MDG9746529.1 hypothetical protein [Leuconostoc mesenteroides]QQB30704.1 hypothetical protein I6H90_07600 [Leuconostoc mesenteroides]STY37588.1 Uncharacterised protein [Leuconostoc mesenteroides]
MKIGLVCAYFGRFPSYFPLFLLSAKHNPNFDFYIYTDNQGPWDVPQNVSIIQCHFSDIKKKIQNLFDFSVNLETPYKLTDYKPLYGQLFQETLKSYSHWGYFDIDTVLGDLSLFASNEDLHTFDRIGSRGHLSIFKNSTKNIFAYKDFPIGKSFTYKEAFSTNIPCHFDEMWGINNIYRNGNYTYKDEVERNSVKYFDASPKAYPLVSVDNHGFQDNPANFTWKQGRLVEWGVSKNMEISYLHLQKRKMTFFMENLGSESFLIDQSSIIQQEVEWTSIEDNLMMQHKNWPDGNIHHLCKYYLTTILSGEQLVKLKLKVKK